jgi:hypothetical protein
VPHFIIYSAGNWVFHSCYDGCILKRSPYVVTVLKDSMHYASFSTVYRAMRTDTNWSEQANTHHSQFSRHFYPKQLTHSHKHAPTYVNSLPLNLLFSLALRTKRGNSVPPGSILMHTTLGRIPFDSIFQTTSSDIDWLLCDQQHGRSPSNWL